MDYDGLYDQAFNNLFSKKLKSIQYNVCIAFTGAIRGTSKGKIYQELELDSLRDWRWFKNFVSFL